MENRHFLSVYFTFYTDLQRGNLIAHKMFVKSQLTGEGNIVKTLIHVHTIYNTCNTV